MTPTSSCVSTGCSRSWRTSICSFCSATKRSEQKSTAGGRSLKCRSIVSSIGWATVLSESGADSPGRHVRLRALARGSRRLVERLDRRHCTLHAVTSVLLVPSFGISSLLLVTARGSDARRAMGLMIVRPLPPSKSLPWWWRHLPVPPSFATAGSATSALCFTVNERWTRTGS